MSAGIGVTVVVCLAAGRRRDAGAPDEAECGEAGCRQGGEARRSQAGLTRLEQQALGRDFSSSS